jgi:hypothetical protein
MRDGRSGAAEALRALLESDDHGLGCKHPDSTTRPRDGSSILQSRTAFTLPFPVNFFSASCPFCFTATFSTRPMGVHLPISRRNIAQTFCLRRRRDLFRPLRTSRDRTWSAHSRRNGSSEVMGQTFRFADPGPAIQQMRHLTIPPNVAARSRLKSVGSFIFDHDWHGDCRYFRSLIHLDASAIRETTVPQPLFRHIRRRSRQSSSNSQARRELVQRIRQEISSGTYDTHSKLAAALERLLAECHASS